MLYQMEIDRPSSLTKVAMSEEYGNDKLTQTLLKKMFYQQSQLPQPLFTLS